MMHRILLAFVCSAWLSVSLAQEFAPRYTLVKLNKEVNTYYHDAAPVISADGKKLYFFITNHPQNTYGKEGSGDIWMATLKEDGNWSAPTHLTSPFNIHRNNQVFTALPDGSLFIKGGKAKDSKGFSIVSTSGTLTEIVVPGFTEMNKARFYGASMSSDAHHIIIYLGEMAGSTRSSLYISNLGSDGKWTRPVKLNISNRDDDFGPFIGPDDRTLYFASDRNVPGKFGKTDIYKVTRLDDTWQNWSEPVNMGAPVNTAGAEMYFCIDKNGEVYMSRAVIGDGGTLDLFKLVPRDITITLKGTVYNEKTNQPLAASVEVIPVDHDPNKLRAQTDGKFTTRLPEVNAYKISASQEGFLPKSQDFKLPVMGTDTTINVDIFLTPIAKKLIIAGSVYDSKTNIPVNSKVQIQYKSKQPQQFQVPAEDGTYEQEIKQLGWYVLTASASGYINTVDSVQAISEDLTPIIKDLILKPIEVGMTVRLKNIYFDFDKTTLRKESFAELNKVVDFLQRNPSVEIKIEGHTDSRGSDEYNLNLSQGRSQSVVDYLISQGIDRNRLSAQGYGESKPIDTNETDEGRANNRRVEFTVVKT
ncbi:MAG: OmpA family protein [Cyclobacteriaceae bacterium]|jgi:outer membrane protein OmpA-like peptidoglycan-associated protein|nr:OmpA family protein [Cyclobacteriaceae bacterium]